MNFSQVEKSVTRILALLVPTTVPSLLSIHILNKKNQFSITISSVPTSLCTSYCYIPVSGRILSPVM